MNQRFARNAAIVFVLAGSLVGSAVHATDALHDFSRYQVIVDRMPFGAMSGAADAPQPSFSAHYTFVGTVKEDDPEPLRAIIFDKDGSQTYFKAEGETMGETSVVKIEKTDKDQVKLVLKQGLEVATLLLETKTGVGAPPAPGARPAVPGMSPTPAPVQPGVRRIPFRRGG